ncbi:hypothetical protein PC122_g8913 [Phytophthora cactorum]|nr:hypothetical protein PC122_g8913 [Phytophthora cactorum]
MSSLSWLLVASLTFIAAINAEECSTSELLTIASNTHLEGCTSDVGFGGFSAISALTDKQIKAVCDSSDCMELMDSMSLTLISGVSAADDACATTDLVGIAGSPHVAGCSADAAFSSISTISELTTEQIQVICASSACTALMKDIGALGLGDCRIPETKIYLQTDIIDAFTEKCSALDSSSSSAGSVTTDNLREGSSSVTSSATTLIMRCIATATMALAVLLV